MSYNKDFKHIRESLNKNTLTIFLGSGISKNSGCIEWWKIIDTFAEELSIKDKEPYYKKSYNDKGEVEFRLDESFEKMIKIPQIYFNEFGKDNYYNLLEKLFSKKYTPHLIHTFLIKLRPKNFITTNYDTLIEDTANEYLEAFDIITCDSDIKPMNNDRLIIKMHGDLNNKNLVLKEDDYLNYSKNFKLTETLVKSILATNITLFVGYSLSDYNVKQIIADIPHDEPTQPRAYFINLTDDYSEFEENYYLRKGIKVLYVRNVLKDYGKDLGKNLLSFLKDMFDNSLNDSVIDDILEILNPFENFYLGVSGLQNLLKEYGIQNNEFGLTSSFDLYNKDEKPQKFFSEVQEKANLNKLIPYFKFNNIRYISVFNDHIWNNPNSHNYNFKFIHEYDTYKPLEKALQFYYLGDYQKSYEVFSNIFKETKLKKNYIETTISAYNIRKMNYFYDIYKYFELSYEIPTSELDFTMDNLPKSYNYLRKLYSHEVAFKYTSNIFHACLKINKKVKYQDIDFLNMTLISFVNFITINKITLDERLSDVNDIIYFAILKVLQSDNEILLEDYHIYLIYIFFNSNLLKDLKTDYSKPIKLKNLDIFIYKLMKDWDFLIKSSVSYARFSNSLALITLLELDYQHLNVIKNKVLSLNSPVTLKLEREINQLLNYIETKKPAN